MKCLYAFVIFVLLVADVKAHLPRINRQHHPFVPFSASHNPLIARPGLFADGSLTQGGLPHFSQMPQTLNNQVWNNGIPTVRLERNGINNNDPWEQYRRFNFGMQSMSDNRLSAPANTMSRPNEIIPGTTNNYPWNTFATQNSFSTNIPIIPNNQGVFVDPNLPNQFQNQGFLSQGFPNSQFQNQGFVSPGFQNNQFQNQGSLNQGFRSGFPASNGAFI